MDPERLNQILDKATGLHLSEAKLQGLNLTQAVDEDGDQIMWAWVSDSIPCLAEEAG